MAATYTPNSAFSYAKNYIKQMPLDTVQYRVLDAVNKIIWMYAPWRWTVGALPTITLTANTQDYVVALPADFLFAIKSDITDQAGGAPRALSIEAIIPVGGLVGQPSRIAFMGVAGTNGTARLLPKIGSSLPSPTPVIISTYKKSAPTISVANGDTPGALVMDDEWAWVFEAGVLWLAYLYGDDARAGTSNADSKGNFAFTGQRAIFQEALKYMHDHEKLIVGDDRLIPDPKVNG